MSDILSRLPNYTCLQTIERMRRRAPARKLELVDMVRLEVALVDGNELFSWPGAGRFEDTEISDMVHGGAIGNGNFALHARGVFMSRAPSFTYIGEQEWNGREALRWDYRVPLNLSGYTLKMGPVEARTAYRGSFWVDADSLDLMRLEVHAVDIPAQLLLKSAQDAVEYARMNIGGRSFLLPKMSQMTLVDVDGSESRNRTEFSSCRQYTGESVLSFDDPAETAAVSQEEKWIELPPKLGLDMALETPIRDGESAVGDPVTAVLIKSLKKGKTVLAPKGSLVHGRITLLRRQDVHSGTHVVGLKFFELEFPGTRAKLNATLNYMAAVGVNVPGSAGAASARQRPAWRLKPEQIAAELAVGGSVFFVKGGLKLERGLRMNWRTAPITEDKQ